MTQHKITTLKTCQLGLKPDQKYSPSRKKEKIKESLQALLQELFFTIYFSTSLFSLSFYFTLCNYVLFLKAHSNLYFCFFTVTFQF